MLFSQTFQDEEQCWSIPSWYLSGNETAWTESERERWKNFWVTEKYIRLSRKIRGIKGEDWFDGEIGWGNFFGKIRARETPYKLGVKF